VSSLLVVVVYLTDSGHHVAYCLRLQSREIEQTDLTDHSNGSVATAGYRRVDVTGVDYPSTSDPLVHPNDAADAGDGRGDATDRREDREYRSRASVTIEIKQ